MEAYRIEDPQSQRLRIHSAIFSSATGDIVSSICAYSLGAPVGVAGLFERPANGSY
jgi:hypothetical protein